MSTPYDYTSIKRQSKRAGIVLCPKCGKMSKKCGKWKMPDGSFNRMYEHSGIIEWGLQKVQVYCVVREEA